MKKNIQINKITIRRILDVCPDFSCTGEYVDDLIDGVIIVEKGEFLEKLPEEYEPPSRSNTHIGFQPYAGGEEVGTEEYYKYGMQDYKRMEAYDRDEWFYMGIKVEAEISYEINEQGQRRLETLASMGLWGVESDSDEEYLKSVEEEELADLKGHLEVFGVDTLDFSNIPVQRKDS
jgi:hypothetical protein